MFVSGAERTVAGDRARAPSHYDPLRAYDALPMRFLRQPDPLRRRAVAPHGAFHHYSIGGELTIEEEDVLDERIEQVTCRWCGTWRRNEHVPVEESA